MYSFLENDAFYHLSKEQKQQIEKNAIRKRFKRGTIIFNEGDPADGVYFISEGYVKIFQNSEKGKERALAILKPGDVIGEMAAFGLNLRSASVKVIEPTEAFFIPQHLFEELLLTIPAFGLKITEIVTERLRLANKQITQLAGDSSRGRVIGQLLYLAEGYSMKHKKGILIKPRLTHSDIAALAGVVRETVTKIYNDLQDRGIITFEKRHLIIRDVERLKNEANLYM